MRRLKVAAIQMRSGISPLENVRQMGEFVAEAVAEGAEYVLTPEMTGILDRDSSRLLRVIKDEDQDPVFTQASRLARENAIHLHVGSTAIDPGGGMAANRGAVFAPDGVRLATYDKIHMFDVELGQGENWRESRVYRPGDRAVVVDAGNFRLGMAICYDIRFPQLFRQQARLGADILTCPAAFTVPTGKAHWETLLRARAIENGAFMIAAAQGGEHEDGRRTFGHSMVISPWGDKLAELGHDEPGVLVCEIDLDAVADARGRIPNLANERKFSISVVDGNDIRSGRPAMGAQG